MNSLVENYRKIAAEVAELSRGETKLLAVSKTFPAQDILELYQHAGVRSFAESHLQELEQKVPALPSDIIWHFIGKLQSNKVRKLVKLVQVFHSVESVSLIERLDRIAGEENRRIKFLIELNLSGEISKSGSSETALPSLMEAAKKCLYSHCIGFMTMAPIDAADAELDQIFGRLAELRDQYLPGGELSMGMSGDFIAAIRNHSTIVRIGSAIFGNRVYLP